MELNPINVTLSIKVFVVKKNVVGLERGALSLMSTN
jgi:hypothetical protein